jgi:hypothetical protein
MRTCPPEPAPRTAWIALITSFATICPNKFRSPRIAGTFASRASSATSPRASKRRHAKRERREAEIHHRETLMPAQIGRFGARPER